MNVGEGSGLSRRSPQDETEVELHLVGGGEASLGDDHSSRVFSPDGNAGRGIAGFCRAGVGSSHRHRPGMFSEGT